VYNGVYDSTDFLLRIPSAFDSLEDILLTGSVLWLLQGNEQLEFSIFKIKITKKITLSVQDKKHDSGRFYMAIYAVMK
jgi:hypothetical protein